MTEPSTLQQARVTFTGKLACLSRPQAEQLVRANGGKPMASVSRSTTLVVVGMLGWPLLPDGHVSRKLERAEQLQKRGFALAIVCEARFLELAGQRPGPSELWKSYPVDQVCTLLQIDPETLQKWERFSLVRSHQGLYDFQDLVSLQTLGQLVRKGVHPATIAASLRGLSAILPGTERPLAQLRIIADHTRNLLADFGDYLLAPSGQLEFTFEKSAPGTPTPLSATGSTGPVPAPDASDWFEYARACEDTEELVEAAEAYRRTLALQPDFPEARFNLGNVLRELGQPDAAIESYHQAILLDPALVQAHYNLADLYLERDDTSRAIKHLQHAVNLVPEYADAHFNLALCHEQSGQLEAATRHWRRYLQLDASSAWAEIARQHLGNLPQAELQ